MSVVSITDIVNVNSVLNKREIPFKLHLSDACGGQSMWIEALSSERKHINSTEITIIEDFFNSINIKLKIDQNTIYIR